MNHDILEMSECALIKLFVIDTKGFESQDEVHVKFMVSICQTKAIFKVEAKFVIRE